MNYKVGDKVRIKDDLVVNREYLNIYFREGMQQYKGKIATIAEIFASYPSRYILDIDRGWYWSDDMLEPVTNEKVKYRAGDYVTFIVGENTFTYTVYSEYLHYRKGGGNHTIFRVLGISEKEEFCKNCYGYTPNGGEFPQYEKDDYEAATRVINALQKECEKYNKAHTGSSMDNPGIVKEGDKVYFSIGEEVLEYEVCLNHLRKTFGPNHAIFEKLQIKDKEAFCEKYYGYTPNGGDFPQYHLDDYEAAQRIIDALKKECQKHNAESIIQASTKLKQSITKPDDDMPATYYDSTPKQCKLIKPTSSEVVLTIKHKSYKF